jgi:hypothetical protein
MYRSALLPEGIVQNLDGSWMANPAFRLMP